MDNNPVYIVVERRTHTEISDTVNQFITRGYRPLGGVSLSFQHVTEQTFLSETCPGPSSQKLVSK